MFFYNNLYLQFKKYQACLAQLNVLEVTKYNISYIWLTEIAIWYQIFIYFFEI